MDNNSCYITHLPEDVLRYICELHARQLTDSIRDLMLFSQLNMVSKKFNTAIDESLIESHFTKTIRTIIVQQLRQVYRHIAPALFTGIGLTAHEGQTFFARILCDVAILHSEDENSLLKRYRWISRPESSQCIARAVPHVPLAREDSHYRRNSEISGENATLRL